MKAFHGDPKVKEKYLGRVKDHREADEIVKGQYWGDGKGCAVGCTIHGDDHLAYETELGIPAQLAHLQDWMFEHLPSEEAKDFPVDFLESIPVGADLKPVLNRFLHWLLVDPEDGIVQHAQDEGAERVKEAILAVAALHSRVIKGEEVPNVQWDAARAAARDAGPYAAAWAAATGAAARAAVSAAARAAVSAAASDAASTAWNAPRTAAIKRQKDKLLELLSEDV